MTWTQNHYGDCDVQPSGKNTTLDITWVEKNLLDREFDLIKFALDRWKLPRCDDSGEIILLESFNIEQEHRTISIPVAGDCAHSIPIED